MADNHTSVSVSNENIKGLEAVRETLKAKNPLFKNISLDMAITYVLTYYEEMRKGVKHD